MFDFLTGLAALTYEFECHGKQWIEVTQLKPIDDEHMAVIAIEKGAIPAVLQLVVRKKRPLSTPKGVPEPPPAPTDYRPTTGERIR